MLKILLLTQNVNTRISRFVWVFGSVRSSPPDPSPWIQMFGGYLHPDADAVDAPFLRKIGMASRDYEKGGIYASELAKARLPASLS